MLPAGKLGLSAGGGSWRFRLHSVARSSFTCSGAATATGVELELLSDAVAYPHLRSQAVVLIQANAFHGW